MYMHLFHVNLNKRSRIYGWKMLSSRLSMKYLMLDIKQPTTNQSKKAVVVICLITGVWNYIKWAMQEDWIGNGNKNIDRRSSHTVNGNKNIDRSSSHTVNGNKTYWQTIFPHMVNKDNTNFNRRSSPLPSKFTT